VGPALLLTLLVGMLGSWPTVVNGSACCCRGGDCHSEELQRCAPSLVAAACCDEPLSPGRSTPASIAALSLALLKPPPFLGLVPWMGGEPPAATEHAYLPSVVLRL